MCFIRSLFGERWDPSSPRGSNPFPVGKVRSRPLRDSFHGCVGFTCLVGICYLAAENLIQPFSPYGTRRVQQETRFPENAGALGRKEIQRVFLEADLRGSETPRDPTAL